MLPARTYSIAELQKLSGFDRRTIVYYSQQGLLPKAGRRGPHTRHSHACLQRLLFIRGLKDMQDRGDSDTITLQDMRQLIDRLGADTIDTLLARGLPAPDILLLLREASAGAPEPGTPGPPVTRPAPEGSPSPTVSDGRSYGLADAGIRTRAPVPLPPRYPPANPLTVPALEPAPADGAGVADASIAPGEDLGTLLRELEIRPAQSGRRLAPGASEQWTEIPITSRIYLSVRGLAAEDSPLADATGRALKRLLRASPPR